MMIRFRLAILPITFAALIGCGVKQDAVEVRPPPTAAPTTLGESDEISAVRAKLDPAERALVEAQEWCVVQTDERLGSMGPPLKLEIDAQPVFVCCAGCKKKALADPKATLAKVAELKAKKLKEKK